MEKIINTISWVSFILSVLCLLFLIPQNKFPLILLTYSIAFLSLYRIWRKNIDSRWAWISTIILYSSTVFAFPLLSDDIYRFMWDGWLLNEGINPFSHLPTDIPIEKSQYAVFLFDNMNSQNYYSVYPAILQGIFALTYMLIPSSIFGQSIVLKIILLGFQWVSFWYGRKLLNVIHLDDRRIFLYILNPLVIIELMGNLHMELIMISFFAMFLWYFHLFLEGRGPKTKNRLASIFTIVLSVASKLVTAIAAPFLIKRLSIKELIRFILIGIGLFLLLFMPLFIGTYENFGKGLDLYFQKFEFNASIYYLIREVGYWWKGYNIIATSGPWLAMIAGVLILFIAWKEKGKDITSLATQIILAFTIYYFLSTTVHPWYISTLVFLALFSRLQFPFLWSFLAILSYSKYYEEINLYYWMVAIEYILLVGFMIWNYNMTRGVKKSTNH